MSVQFLQASVCNRLLRAMSPDDFALIEPHLLLVKTPSGTVLILPRARIDHLYFPEHGFTSVTIDSPAGPIEVGMIGREGLVGASPVLLGVDSTPHRSFIQMPGDHFRIATSYFQTAVSRSSTLQALLLRYVQTLLVQSAQTAYANASCSVEVRLSRWILMCHDRADGSDIQITHEFLSMMLGVRRPGVTVATQVLEGKHLIRATRGHILVLDRKGLMALAEGSYGLPESEYALLIDGPAEAFHPRPVRMWLVTHSRC